MVTKLGHETGSRERFVTFVHQSRSRNGHTGPFCPALGQDRYVTTENTNGAFIDDLLYVAECSFGTICATYHAFGLAYFEI